MSIFRGIPDELNRHLDQSFLEIAARIRSLGKHLGIGSYKDMTSEGRDLAEIARLERELAKALARKPVASADAFQAPRSVVLSFLAAHRLAALYPACVGAADELSSSAELKTFPLFRPAYTAAPAAAAYAALDARFRLHPDERELLEGKVRAAEGRIALKRAVVKAIRRRISEEAPGRISKGAAARAYSLFAGEHPLRSGEIDVVISGTGLYFWLAPAERLDTQRRSGEELRAASEYVADQARFHFEKFMHFPAFSCFDPESCDPLLLEGIAAESGLPQHELRSLLGSLVNVQVGDDLEKYLIHDTWGHAWQDVLSGVKEHYERLVLLQLPFSADTVVSIAGRAAGLVEAIGLAPDGSIRYDEGLADALIHGIMRTRLSAVLAPVCAELLADVVEYSFLADNPGAAAYLTSSSVFKGNPAKLDFAWSDLKFFVGWMNKRALKGASDAGLAASLADRLEELIRYRYSSAFPLAIGRPGFRADLKRCVERFTSRMAELHKLHLNTDLDASDGRDAGGINDFFRLFTNLLQIACTINELLKERLPGERPELLRYRELILIFGLQFFERDPEANFWCMDETLAAWTIPMLDIIHQAEIGQL